MKYLLFILSFLFFLSSLSAQLNVTYKSNLSFGEITSDVWGYVGPDGKEYALVGLREGVAIVDVTDTENPQEKGRAPGPSSTWRDIKTYGSYAYVTNETSGGILIIDLSNLPNELTENDYSYWAPEINPQDTLSSCHNIFIDEFGYGYLVGCNVNTGGLMYLDLFSNPGSPALVSLGPPVYSHDIYVRDNIAYSSVIYEGYFAIYDVSDKSNTVFLGSHDTPFNFTHNTWPSDDGRFLFTTDEKPDAPVASYDISDLNNIQELDQFRPLQSIGTERTPHNVHVWNDWLIISYYSEGCIIVDASRPENLIEVGNFDTFLPDGTGMNNSAWGAYPYLPSGTILISDIVNGLFVLEPEYVRACWLEGNITDALTGAPIVGVKVDILTDEANQAKTDLSGDYSTGLANSGTYDIRVSHPYYKDKTVFATLENGVVKVLDLQMDTTATREFNGRVTEAITGNPISGAKILLDSDDIDYETVSDADGYFYFPAVLDDDYELYSGKWGYETISYPITFPINNENITIQLAQEYSDDFVLDLGWTVLNEAERGHWERGIPIEVIAANGIQLTPSADVEGDLGTSCYLTGNTAGATPLDDVDNGFVQLQSPDMDLMAYKDPILKFHYWFLDTTGFATPDDTLKILLVYGEEVQVLENITLGEGKWESLEIHLNDHVPCFDKTVSIIFEVSDGAFESNADNSVEAAIDAFEIFDGAPPIVDASKNAVEMIAFPNPFAQTFTLQYQFDAFPANAVLRIYNVLGQEIEEVALNNIRCDLPIRSIQNQGVYILQIQAEGMEAEVLKVVKGL